MGIGAGEVHAYPVGCIYRRLDLHPIAPPFCLPATLPGAPTIDIVPAATGSGSGVPVVTWPNFGTAGAVHDATTTTSYGTAKIGFSPPGPMYMQLTGGAVKVLSGDSCLR
jgi:hypothetical protein